MYASNSESFLLCEMNDRRGGTLRKNTQGIYTPEPCFIFALLNVEFVLCSYESRLSAVTDLQCVIIFASKACAVTRI